MELPVSPPVFFGIAALLGLVVLLWLVYITLVVRRFGPGQEKIKQLAGEGNLASAITGSLEEIDALKKRLGELDERQSGLEERGEYAVQKIGLVRFDAFSDLGGQLSFAAALLNNKGDGLVISSIYGSGESRSYAKRVSESKSNYRLSREEEQAIAQAFAEEKSPQ